MADAELKVGEPRSREPFSLDFSFTLKAPGLQYNLDWGIIAVLAAGLVSRILLALLPGFGVDIGAFEAWSGRLADKGPWHFYAADYFSDYAPGYLYILWLIGKLNSVFHFSPGVFEYILKIPPITADLGSAYLLYRFLEGQRHGLRLLAAAAYLAFPAALLIGAIWGQVDSLSAFFLLLSIYYISRKRPIGGSVAYVVGFVIKPQIIAALPFLAFWVMKEHPPRWVAAARDAWQWLAGCLLLFAGLLTALALYAAGGPDLLAAAGLVIAAAGAVLLAGDIRARPSQAAEIQSREFPKSLPVPPRLWIYITAASLGAMLLLVFPFFPGHPWQFIDQLKDSADVPNYRVNSFWAYNFWGMFGFFKPDDTEYLGIGYRFWGLALFGLTTGAVIYAMRKSEGDGALALGTALCLLAFYLFVTRMHERYLFPFFLPFLAACVIYRNPLLWAAFVVLGLLHFLNLYHVYAYYNPNDLRIEGIYKWFEKSDFLETGMETSRVLSVPLFLSFPLLLGTAYLLHNRLRRSPAT